MSRADALHAAFGQLAEGHAQNAQHAFQALLNLDPGLLEARYGLLCAKIAQSTWTPADGSVEAVIEQIVTKESLDYPLVLVTVARETIARAG